MDIMVNELDTTQHATRPEIKDDLKTFSILMRRLSAGSTMDTILEAVESGPVLKEEVLRRVDQAKIDEAIRRQALKDYHDDRDSWKAEAAKAEERIRQLEQSLLGKEKSIAELKSTSNHLEKRCKKLKEACTQQNTALKTYHEKAKAFDGMLGSERKEKAACQQQIRMQKEQALQHRAEMESFRAHGFHLSAQLSTHKHTIEGLEGLKTPLSDKPEILQVLEPVWESALALVNSILQRNLPPEGLKFSPFWESMGSLSRRTPLPRSNTVAAKQMRIIALLALIARIFVDNIFHPTYLVSAQSELRHHLLQQAKQDSIEGTAFESAARAHLRSLLPMEMKIACSSRVDDTQMQIMKMVKGLFSQVEENEFQRNIHALATRAAEMWQLIACHTEAVRFSFEPEAFVDHHWCIINFQPQARIMEQVARDVRRDDNPLFVVIPRLLVWNDGEQEPETHGVIFMRSQSLEACAEVEKPPHSPGLGRTLSRSDKQSQHRRNASATASGVDAIKKQSLPEGMSTEGSQK